MKIFLIETKERLADTAKQLEKYGEVVVLDKNEKDINKYPELFEDDTEKILAIAPGQIDWKVPVETLQKIKNIKAICTKSAWALYLDIEYCKKHNIIVTNCPGANSQSVAEYAIWMMLSLAKKLPLQMRENFKVAWNDAHTQVEVMGKTAGIIGYGNIGSRIAKMAHGLGMRVTYWSRKKKSSEFDYLELDTLLSSSDFVFNCLETSTETQGFLNKEKLAQMKPSAFFISVLGGMGYGVQDDQCLLEMMNQERLAGFAVENEHEQTARFPTTFDTNVFTPGAYAWFTKEAHERTYRVWLESIVGVSTDKPVNVIT